jgi:hypothetical protein
MSKLPPILMKHFKTITNLAEKLNIRRNAIYQWNGIIPIFRAYQIEHLTKGKIKVRQLIKQKK